MTTEPLTQLAGLYLLELLDPAEVRRVNRALAAGDPELGAAMVEARETGGALALLPKPVPPPRSLKDRLMTRVKADTSLGIGALRSIEGQWKSKEPGVSYKVLYVDKMSGMVTTLVRMEPGSRISSHVHSRPEQCLILEGDLIHDDQVYARGDFTYAEAWTVDPGLSTRNGNLLLIIAGLEGGELAL